MSRALDTLAARIGDLMQAEREHAADLSHRLRTPLTALRLDAERLEDRPRRSASSAAVDDLEAAVTSVIAETRRERRDARAARHRPRRGGARAHGVLGRARAGTAATARTAAARPAACRSTRTATTCRSSSTCSSATCCATRPPVARARVTTAPEPEGGGRLIVEDAGPGFDANVARSARGTGLRPRHRAARSRATRAGTSTSDGASSAARASRSIWARREPSTYANRADATAARGSQRKVRSSLGQMTRARLHFRRPRPTMRHVSSASRRSPCRSPRPRPERSPHRSPSSPPAEPSPARRSSTCPCSASVPRRRRRQRSRSRPSASRAHRKVAPIGVVRTRFVDEIVHRPAPHVATAVAARGHRRDAGDTVAPRRRRLGRARQRTAARAADAPTADAVATTTTATMSRRARRRRRRARRRARRRRLGARPGRPMSDPTRRIRAAWPVSRRRAATRSRRRRRTRPRGGRVAATGRRARARCSASSARSARTRRPAPTTASAAAADDRSADHGGTAFVTTTPTTIVWRVVHR